MQNTEILKYVYRIIIIVALMVIISAFAPTFNDKLLSLFGDIITSSLSFFFGITTGAGITYAIGKNKQKTEESEEGE